MNDDEDLALYAIEGLVPLLKYLGDNFATAPRAVGTALLAVHFILEGARAQGSAGAPTLTELCEQVTGMKIDRVSKDAMLVGLDAIIARLEGRLPKKSN